MREKIREQCGKLYDIERIISRITVGIGTPHSLITLRDTLNAAEHIEKYLKSLSSSYLQERRELIPEVLHLATYISERIIDNPPFDPKSGGLIKDGINKELDTLRESIKDSQQWIANLESQERKRTGISNLKVRFNNVFGYYIEISKSNLDLVPKDYIRKQTTVNAERFITEELQKYEDIVLHGQELINKKEYSLFLETLSHVLESTKKLQACAQALAEIDCIACFAVHAERERYVKPRITTDQELKIEDGRHPVVEQLENTSFVPNNTLLNDEDHQLLVITGPNMAGKSVYMRQVALIVLMAHMGSFVPSKRASIPLVDRIFVRSGASDSIGKGLSTFMVEMVETAYILNHATEKSLIIMDEIGRGTSTYDGISIAWAVAEYLVTEKKSQAKTLFATHYHELQQLESRYPEKIKNYHMAIEESRNNPVFLYRLTRGGAHGSYAIAVAKLAGIPKSVTSRATTLLKSFNEQNQEGLIIEEK
jgi:DNA mismatch repair protein MutS